MRIRRNDAPDTRDEGTTVEEPAGTTTGAGTTGAPGTTTGAGTTTRRGTSTAAGDRVTPRKGRPTPTKAEAAARNRQPLVVTDRRAAKRRAREERNKAYALQQQAMRTGDDRYLPPRDRGPVRRAARDWVDARFLPSQVFLPGAFVIMLGMLIVGRFFPGFEGYIVLAMYILLIVSILVSVIAVHLMKRSLVAEFGDRYVNGTIWYAFMRAMYPRFLRQPRPQVATGGGPVKPKGKK